jgi:hypothetical protein
VSLRMINSVYANRSIDSHCALCGRPFASAASNLEHIFPKWLQHQHNLWNKRLTLPNFIGRTYKGVKIRVCEKCNNVRFGQLESKLSGLFKNADSYEALQQVSDGDLGVWLGKISWLLCRVSHAQEDFRTRAQVIPEQIVPGELIPGTYYLGILERAFAMKKQMLSCYADDPPALSSYSAPYSLYRFLIDTRDTRFEPFDFADNLFVLGTAFRSGNTGLICLFDGGLHRRFRAHRFASLSSKALHPMQFNEVVGRMFYDQTVVEQNAQAVTYFWNPLLKAVIAMTRWPRFADPYIQENHDLKRYASFIGRHTFSDPASVVTNDGEVFTVLWDENEQFMPYAVSDEEVMQALRNPRRRAVGPTASKWRQQPPE